MEIRKRLTAEEEMGELASSLVDSTDDHTETSYLLCGLDLEEQQYVFDGLFSVLGTNRLQGANCSLHSRPPLRNLHPPRSSNFEPHSVAVWPGFVCCKRNTNPRSCLCSLSFPWLISRPVPSKMHHFIFRPRCPLKP